MNDHVSVGGTSGITWRNVKSDSKSVTKFISVQIKPIQSGFTKSLC